MLHFEKRKQYRLTIENPCGQNWDKMKAAPDGKYCLHCSKHIIDFTRMSDEEIVRIISEPGSICGRLTSEQQNRNLVSNQHSSPLTVFSKIAAGFLFIGTSATAIPPAKASKTIASNLEVRNDVSSEVSVKKEKLSLLSPIDELIKGTVADSITKESIPGATIVIENTTIATSTDMNGDFSIAIPRQQENEEIRLTISAIGYKTLTVLIKQKDLQKQQEFFLSSEVIIYVLDQT